MAALTICLPVKPDFSYLYDVHLFTYVPHVTIKKEMRCMSSKINVKFILLGSILSVLCKRHKLYIGITAIDPENFVN